MLVLREECEQQIGWDNKSLVWTAEKVLDYRQADQFVLIPDRLNCVIAGDTFKAPQRHIQAIAVFTSLCCNKQDGCF